MQHIPAEEIPFYNKVKLSVSIDSLLCYYYPEIKCSGTELRERIYIKHSIDKYFRSVALDEIPTVTCEPSEIATWKGFKIRQGT